MAVKSLHLNIHVLLKERGKNSPTPKRTGYVFLVYTFELVLRETVSLKYVGDLENAT